MNFVEDDMFYVRSEFHLIWSAFIAGFDVFELREAIPSHELIDSLAPPPIAWDIYINSSNIENELCWR